jgi:diguanylate cyclase (GGDEF)-like protein
MDDFFKKPQITEDSMLAPDEEAAILRQENRILREAHASLVMQLDALGRNAFYDELTGLYSRKFFTKEMERLGKIIFRDKFNEEKRVALPSDKDGVALLVFDLDKFHEIKDTRGGTDAEDLVLKTVAQVMKELIREYDLHVRWEGDKMAVMQVDTYLSDALKKAEEIRSAIENISFANYEKFPLLKDFKITSSVGVVHSSDVDGVDALFKASDKALYESKSAGGNKVTAFSG